MHFHNTGIAYKLEAWIMPTMTHTAWQKHRSKNEKVKKIIAEKNFSMSKRFADPRKFTPIDPLRDILHWKRNLIKFHLLELTC